MDTGFTGEAHLRLPPEFMENAFPSIDEMDSMPCEDSNGVPSVAPITREGKVSKINDENYVAENLVVMFGVGDPLLGLPFLHLGELDLNGQTDQGIFELPESS
jgi:predicted aspartyl protease